MAGTPTSSATPPRFAQKARSSLLVRRVGWNADKVSRPLSIVSGRECRGSPKEGQSQRGERVTAVNVSCPGVSEVHVNIFDRRDTCGLTRLSIRSIAA